MQTLTQKGYQEGTAFAVYHCQQCSTAFSYPRPDTAELYQLIYKKGDLVPGYGRYWKYFEEVKTQNNPLDYLANSEAAYWALVYALKKTLNVDKNANILEIGSGLGYLTYALRKDGYTNAVGLDIAADAVKRANQHFGNFYVAADAAQYASESQKKWDVVFMTEVIEHIENPLALIKSLIPLLNENGTLIFTTPNKSVYPPEIAWATDKPPVHCWWFSEKSFEYIAGSLRMNATFVDFTPYYTNHRRMLINSKLDQDIANRYVFDKNGELMQNETVNNLKNFRILPDWVKNTFLYRKIAHLIYPILMKSITKVDKHKSTTLCVLLSLRKDL